jgi:iron complex outermembrane receptor protein
MNLWNVKYTQFTQELRISGRVGSLIDWTVGGFYFRANARQGGRISLDGAGDNLIPFAVTTDFLFDDPVRIRSKSGFAHIELQREIKAKSGAPTV